MAASPAATCMGLLTSSGTEWVSAWQSFVRARPGLCWYFVWERESRVCVCVVREPAKYSVFSGWRVSQKPSRTTQITSPFHHSLHLHLQNPGLLGQTNPFLTTVMLPPPRLHFLQMPLVAVSFQEKEAECGCNNRSFAVKIHQLNLNQRRLKLELLRGKPLQYRRKSYWPILVHF